MMKEYAQTFDSIAIKGKTVADFGAWNGAFTAEAARRGAKHITAVDHVTWNRPGWHGRESFDFVVNHFGLPVTALDIDLDSPTLVLKDVGEHDVVLFLGVFYHLRDPIAALREVAALAREVLVVETHVDHCLGDGPAMVYYPSDELAGDGSNWWGPNMACVEALLKGLNFSRVEGRQGVDPNRAVFHAWR